MRCAFCGSNRAKLKSRMANTESGGLIRLNVCSVDEVAVDDSFAYPLTMKMLISMQKGVLA